MTVVDNVIDSIVSPETTSQPIPGEVMGAAALLAYIKGNSWLTWGPYNRARPDLARKRWIIPVSLTYDIPWGLKRAMYDIETGGGTNENIGHFADRCDRSEPFYLYTFASNGARMLAMARGLGYVQGRDFYYLAAHANGKRHVCTPDLCGFPRSDGTQYLFAGSYDRSVFNDYALPHAPKPAPVDPYDLFPTFVGDAHLPNGGNERVTVEQADGALEHPLLYRGYLKDKLRLELKTYRDRVMRIATFEPPDFVKANPHPAWNDERRLGARWQGLERRLQRIDAIK